MISRSYAAVLLSAILALAACASPPPPPEAVKPHTAVGAVQREIKPGMTQPDVIAALGAPNLISTDSQRREVWTYDHISNERVDTSKSVSGGIVVLGSAQPAAEASPGARTLTLNIYYDEQKKIREIAYNYSTIQPAD